MAYGTNVMSLYHTLETVPIPGIGSLKIGETGQEPEYEMPMSQTEFASPPSTDQDQFFTSRQEPTQVTPPVQVMDVAGRFFGQGQGTDRRRLTLSRDDVDLPDQEGGEESNPLMAGGAVGF